MTPCNEEFLARTFGDHAERIFDEFAGLALRRPLDGGALHAAAVRLREIGLRYGPEAERETTTFLLEVATGPGPAERAVAARAAVANAQQAEPTTWTTTTRRRRP